MNVFVKCPKIIFRIILGNKKTLGTWEVDTFRVE
jgi:hypothetical protein